MLFVCKFQRILSNKLAYNYVVTSYTVPTVNLIAVKYLFM